MVVMRSLLAQVTSGGNFTRVKIPQGVGGKVGIIDRKPEAIGVGRVPPRGKFGTLSPDDRVAVEAAEAGPSAALVSPVTLQAVEPGHQPADGDRALQTGQDRAQTHMHA